MLTTSNQLSHLKHSLLSSQKLQVTASTHKLNDPQTYNYPEQQTLTVFSFPSAVIAYTIKIPYLTPKQRNRKVSQVRNLYLLLPSAACGSLGTIRQAREKTVNFKPQKGESVSVRTLSMFHLRSSAVSLGASLGISWTETVVNGSAIVFELNTWSNDAASF